MDPNQKPMQPAADPNAPVAPGAPVVPGGMPPVDQPAVVPGGMPTSVGEDVPQTPVGMPGAEVPGAQVPSEPTASDAPAPEQPAMPAPEAGMGGGTKPQGGQMPPVGGVQ